MLLQIANPACNSSKQSLMLAERPCYTRREFRPILKECYSQDTSQSSRLQFELKKSEAQNLCRAFNNASARVNLGAGLKRTASPTVASSSKTAAPSNSMAEAPKIEVLYTCMLLQLVSNAIAAEQQPRLAGMKARKSAMPATKKAPMGLSTNMVLVLAIPTLLSHQMHFSFALIHMQSSYFQPGKPCRCASPLAGDNVICKADANHKTQDNARQREGLTPWQFKMRAAKHLCIYHSMHVPFIVCTARWLAPFQLLLLSSSLRTKGICQMSIIYIFFFAGDLSCFGWHLRQ